MATLELRQVTKSFGPTKVIHGIDLAIDHGEFIVFVGPPAAASPRCCA